MWRRRQQRCKIRHKYQRRRSLVSSGDSNDTSASPKAGSNTDSSVFAKFKESTPLTNYSYGTTDADEFTTLLRSYLLSKQQEMNNSYLSTKARGKDGNGDNITTYSFACWYCGEFVAGFRNHIMGLVTQCSCPSTAAEDFKK